MEMPKNLEWIDETTSLLTLGLRCEDPSSNENVMINAVLKRCEERFGPSIGRQFYDSLLVNLPQIRQDLFPELWEARE